MAAVRVGGLDDLSNDRTACSVGDREIVVFGFGAELFAYENRCPHLDGPVCNGRIMPAVVPVLDDDRVLVRNRFDASQPRLVCPWHGWEFDLRTGACIADRRKRLKRVPIELREDGVYVNE